MFKLEVRKSLKGNIILYIIVISIISFLLGYILPIGIDKVKNLSLSNYLFSTYTVITQFGFLLFAFVISLFFNKEFSEKTILFYKLNNIDSLKFFIYKVTTLFIETTLSVLFCTLIVSFLYKDFSKTLFFIVIISIIILQYILIIGFISMLFSNILFSLATSILYWLISIILVQINGIFKYIALFDASNKLYVQVSDFFFHGNFPSSSIITIISFIAIVFLITTVLSKLIHTRWLRNGI